LFHKIFIAQHHHHHRTPYLKKLTHPDFPHGGYLLVQHPLRRYSSRTNHFDETLSENEIANDILTFDINQQQQAANRRLKNKYNLKFKREADQSMIEYCCTQTPQDLCALYFCV
jgi:hypothetical protein